MLDTLWISAPAWDAQPSKKRRITMDELDLDLQRLSLSEKASVAAELPTLLRGLSLSGYRTPTPSRAGCGASMPREFAPKVQPACFKITSKSSDEEDKENIMKDILAEHEKAVLGADCSSSRKQERPVVLCTAIVPFQKSPRQPRWRRIPRVTPIPISLPAPPISAKFAVDSTGTAFVIPDHLRSGLFRGRDQWKRNYVEEQQTHVSSAAIVIYQKPRKHDLVEDFMTLKL